MKPNKHNNQRCRNEDGRFESCGNSGDSTMGSAKKSSEHRGNASQPRNAEGRFTKK